jgi:hypothetical protein
MHNICSAPLTSVPVWAREFNSPEELITEFCRECRVVRKGMQFLSCKRGFVLRTCNLFALEIIGCRHICVYLFCFLFAFIRVGW